MKFSKLFLALSFVVSSAAVMADEVAALVVTPATEVVAPAADAKAEVAAPAAEVKAEESTLEMLKGLPVRAYNATTGAFKTANDKVLAFEKDMTPKVVSEGYATVTEWIANNQVTLALSTAVVVGLGYYAYNNVSKKSKN